VRDAADGGVEARSAERFGVDHLAGRALHEIGSAESHEARALHHEDDVAQGGQVRASGDAGTHHRGDLRDAEFAAHQRVVVEDTPGAVLAREDAVLVGKIDARGIDQVHDRQAIAHRDLLRAQDLGDRLRPPRARFDGRVVGYHHGGAPGNAADHRHDTGRRCLAIVAVVRDEQADLERWAAIVEQPGDAFPRGQFAALMLAVDAGAAASGAQTILEGPYLLDKVAHVSNAGDAVGRFGLRVHGSPFIVPREHAPAARGMRSAVITLTCLDLVVFVGYLDI
jgi:hypothetical protein